MSLKKSQKSYSEVMNEWQEQRSFLKRFRSRLLHPPYEALWYEKLWGYTWRMGVVAIAAIALGYTYLTVRLRTPAFRSNLAEQVAKRFHATNVKCGSIRSSLTGSGCLITAMGADGAPGCAFNRMDAHGLSFGLGSKIFRTDWTIDRISFNDLKLDVRTGGGGEILSAPAPEIKLEIPENRVFIPEFKTSSAFKQQILLKAGYGITPRHDELKIKSYATGNFDATWGYSKTTQGGISDAHMLAEQTSEDAWRFVCTSGKFSQNWLSDLNIVNLEVKMAPDKFTINEAKFATGTRGELNLRGSLALKETYVVDVGLTGKQVELHRFLPEPFRRYFSGYGDMEGVISGTVSLSSGVTSRISVKLVPGPIDENETKNKSKQSEPVINVGQFASNIPLFRSLYVATSENRLMQVTLTKGSFDIESGGGKCYISNINLEGGDYFRLKGSIEVSEELEGDGAAIKGGPKHKFDAKLMVGLNPKATKHLAPTLMEKHFKTESEGFSWMDCVLANDDGTDLTRAMGVEITRLHRESLSK